MSFSFNFSGDDIDESIEQDSGAGNVEGGAEVTVADTVPAVDVMRHDLRELVGLVSSCFVTVLLSFLICFLGYRCVWGCPAVVFRIAERVEFRAAFTRVWMKRANYSGSFCTAFPYCLSSLRASPISQSVFLKKSSIIQLGPSCSGATSLFCTFASAPAIAYILLQIYIAHLQSLPHLNPSPSHSD